MRLYVVGMLLCVCRMATLGGERWLKKEEDETSLSGARVGGELITGVTSL